MSLYQRALLQGIGKIFTLPRLSAPLIITLGFTLGAVLCVLAVFSVLQLKPLSGVSKEANLYNISIEMALSEKLKVSVMSLKRFAHFKKHFARYGIWSAFNQSDEQLNLNDQSLAITEFIASRRILDVLGLPLIKGENPDIEEVEEKIWISNSLWRTAYSGREDILEKTLAYKGKTYQIAGIIPDFTAVDSGEIVVPQQIWLISNENAQFKKAEEGNLNGNYEKILLRKTTNNLPTTQQLLDWNTQYTNEQIASEEVKAIFKVRNTTADIKLYRDDLIESSELLLTLMAVAVFGLLVMASLNLLNLFIAHYQSRGKEFSIQISLGASLNRLRLMLMMENLPAFVAAGLLGLLIAGWGIRSLPELAGGKLPMLNEASLDVFTCTAAFFMVLLLALVFSLFAFVGVNHQRPIDTLNSSGKGTPAQSKQWLGRSLMVLQLSLATMLVTGSVMLARQSYEVVYQPLGYKLGNSYQARIHFNDEQWQQSLQFVEKYYGSEYQILRHELKREIETTILEAKVLDAHQAPLSHSLELNITQIDTEKAVLHQYKSLSKDYFSSFNIVFLAGRNLTQEEIEAGDKLIVIDERMARKISTTSNPEDALGMEIELTNTEISKHKVIGVINNTVTRLDVIGSHEFPEIYSSRVRLQRSLDLTILMPEGKTLTKKSLEQALANKDDRLGKIDFTSLQERWSEQTQAQRISLWLTVAMTALTLFIAAVGIAGLTQMTTNQKRYELAIRMATGSKQARLMQLVFKDAGWMLGLGLIFGFVLSSLGYNKIGQTISLMPPFDWASMIGLNIILTLVVLVAVALPAWRIIKADPMQALREL